jgi:hypothetical protein
MVLPQLFFQKKKQRQYKRFTIIACTIIGISIIAHGIIDLLKILLEILE